MTIKQITIDIDIDELTNRLKQVAVDTVVSRFFDADDIGGWEERKKARAERLKKVMGEVDWNLLPQEIQTGIVRKFIDDYILGKPR